MFGGDEEVAMVKNLSQSAGVLAQDKCVKTFVFTFLLLGFGVGLVRTKLIFDIYFLSPTQAKSL